MLKIQKFLNEVNNPIEALKLPPYSLNIKTHPYFTNLVQFTYDQIESQRDNEIVQEARGIILNSLDDWSVVAYPFKRFFNYGEGPAAEIDWTTARVQEKVDGTLIIMYYYGNQWNVATKGSPDAGGQVGDWMMQKGSQSVPMTFSDLFWNSCEYWMKGLSKSGIFDKNCTYMWELTSPKNRIVCDYTVIGKTKLYAETEENCKAIAEGREPEFSDEMDDDHTGYAHDGSRITLIGIRNNLTLYEYPIRLYRDDVYYVAKEFPLTSFDEVLKAAEELNPLKQEGFVVVDGHFNRVKIKSPAYVAIHHLRDGSPRRRLMDLIKSGEESEVLSYNLLDEFPAEKRMFEEMREKLDGIILQTEMVYDRIKDIEIQKEFALEALKAPHSAPMFAFRKGAVRSIREWFMNSPTDKLLDMVDKEN